MQKRTLLALLGSLLALPARALYDPKPNALLEQANGTWQGTLTYRDYQNPDRMVTLKASMTIALLTPDELALYYVFDDGPDKTVYSYERMRFDLEARQLLWLSGTTKSTRSEYQILSAMVQNGTSTITFERVVDQRTDSYVLEISKRTWSLTKTESAAGAAARLRSKYAFSKSDA